MQDGFVKAYHTLFCRAFDETVLCRVARNSRLALPRAAGYLLWQLLFEPLRWNPDVGTVAIAGLKRPKIPQFQRMPL